MGEWTLEASLSPGIELTCCHFYHILLAKAGHRTTASSQGAGTYSASMARLRTSEQEGATSNEGEAWNENVPAFHGWPLRVASRIDVRMDILYNRKLLWPRKGK